MCGGCWERDEWVGRLILFLGIFGVGGMLLMIREGW